MFEKEILFKLSNVTNIVFKIHPGSHPVMGNVNLFADLTLCESLTKDNPAFEPPSQSRRERRNPYAHTGSTHVPSDSASRSFWD